MQLITKDRTLPAEFTIGADPELFGFIGNTPVSVHELLPGDKQHPFKVPYGAVQVDGIAGEFNIDPCKTKKEFVRNIMSVRETMEGMVKEKNPKVYFKGVPWVRFTERYFAGLPNDVKILGCDPDFSPYAMKAYSSQLVANPRPDPVALGIPTVRTGSGHIHIGWKVNPDPEIHVLDCKKLVETLDFYLGPMENKWDLSTTRRNLYGKPGAFRVKPYGVEYRVLSNRWVDNQYVMEGVFDVVAYVLSQYAPLGNYNKYCPYPKVERDIVRQHWRKYDV